MKKKSAAATTQHLLLLRHPNRGPGPTPAELEKIMERFGLWMAGLHAKGLVAGTNGLGPTGKILHGPLGETVVTDGPYAEAKEVVGGYVLLNVATMKAALAIARRCPGLDHRMAVEVRPVVQCDDGGAAR
jgi:hypothetical protein